MTTERAKAISETAMTQLIESLERGHSETLKAYLSMMAKFHQYSWGNILLIHAQRPNATHVAGFHSWLKFRRHVRKGEKGIAILAPMVGRKKSDDVLTEDETTRLFGFRAAHVFDISQTDGEPLPEFASVCGDPAGYLERLIRFIEIQEISLEYDSSIAPALGVSSGGKIRLQPDLPSAQHFAVLVHELAHELLHRGSRRSETSRTLRETEAEAVAYAVCSGIGPDPMTASSDYIQLYAGDKAILNGSLTPIQQTASTILQSIANGETTHYD